MTMPTNDNTALQLSAIYRRCLDDLEGTCGFDLRSEFYDQAVERINEAVSEALAVVGQRCPKCTSSNVAIFCKDCAVLSADPEWEKVEGIQ